MSENRKGKNTVYFSVVPWGHMNMAELDNAIRAANLSQHSFEFTFIRDIVPILEDRYRLSNGGLDLESAARDLIVAKRLRGTSDFLYLRVATRRGNVSILPR